MIRTRPPPMPMHRPRTYGPSMDRIGNPIRMLFGGMSSRSVALTSVVAAMIMLAIFIPIESWITIRATLIYWDCCDGAVGTAIAMAV